MSLPNVVNIAGVPHTVTYCDKPSEVDVFKRESLWGQLDPWTKTIRIYKNGNPYASVLKIILHEMLHAYGCEWNIEHFYSRGASQEQREIVEQNTESTVNIFFDMLERNSWMEEIYAALGEEES